ncbi:prolyl oligopeptidase family serine peptidase [Streptomyces sp. NPDC003077]|uniref:prolyl oligopeptidase family serine peptidase n=1 Tax=Streptomyces sp. NPDC003077 TaxID=3154443 RepID=UPI0033A103C3
MSPTRSATLRDDTLEHLHGYPVRDPYRGLENSDAPEVRAWADEQDERFARERERWADHESWARAVSELAVTRWSAPPVWRGDTAFFAQLGAGEAYPALCVHAPGAPTRRLVDPARLDPSGNTRLVAWRPSQEGHRLAYLLSRSGSDVTELWVLRTADGQVLEGPITGMRAPSVAWSPGGEAFYYVRGRGSDGNTGGGDGRQEPGGGNEDGAPPSPAGYRMRVLRHRIGTDPEDDEEVFARGGADTYYGLSTDRAGRRLAVTVTSGVSTHNEVWLTDLTRPHGERTWTRVPAHGPDGLWQPRFGPDGQMYLLTDHRAPFGRVLRPAERDTDRDGPDGPKRDDATRHTTEDWTELIPQTPHAALDDCAWLTLRHPDRPRLLVLRTHGVHSRITLHDAADGRELAQVPLPGSGVVTGLRSRPEGGHEAWFTYTDPGTPPTVLRYDALTGRVDPAGLDEAASPVPAPGQGTPEGSATRPATPAPRPAPAPPTGRLRPRRLPPRSRHLICPATDSTLIDLYLLAPADAPVGPRPVLLSGYGGFGATIRPAYSPMARAWAAAGGIYVMAGVRGGGDHGTAWHHAGRRENKATAIADFLSVAYWLVDNGYTTRAQLAAYGNSHGGLLVTAALTQRPGLFAAVAASGPLCDMVRYERFGIGHTWTEEFGTAADPAHLPWLLSYSPYHHVRPHTAYPAVLLTGPVVDERTGEAHPRKMCAALQEATTSGKPVLLRREPATGHGPLGTATAAAVLTDTLTFLATHTGLRPPTGEEERQTG